MRTLQEALIEHLGCEHGLEVRMRATIEELDPVVKVIHGDHWWETIIDPAEDATAFGSAMFHLFANKLIGFDGHSDHTLHITDAEFASYVEAARAV